MRVLGIDPGTAGAGVVVFDTTLRRAVFADGSMPNADVWSNLVDALIHRNPRAVFAAVDLVVVEKVASYGRPVGEQVFTTVETAGEYVSICRLAAVPVERLTFPAVARHFCRSAANEASVRQVILDRFGPDPVGRKAAPGPLYHVKKHAWSALAVALAAIERQEVGYEWETHWKSISPR